MNWGMAVGISGPMAAAAAIMRDASSDDIAIAIRLLWASRWTWPPMLPAIPPTASGNSGPSRKKKNARLNSTARKSRRAITHAA